MAVLGPRFLVKGQGDEDEIEVQGKGEPSKNDKMVYSETKEGIDKFSGSVEPVLNYVKYVSEDEDKGVKIDVTSGQICSECVEKEIDDTNNTSKDTNKQDNEVDIVQTFDTSDNSDNRIVPAKVDTARTEPPISMTANQNVTRDVQEPITDNDTIDVNMRKDDYEKDNTIDKATGTDEEPNENRRPQYVSSIIVELSDSTT